MKNVILLLLLVASFISCNTNSTGTASETGRNAQVQDTLSYPYNATYSSDLTVPSNPLYVQKVLTVWKLYEQKQFGAMKPYYADTVTYDAANGFHYYGSS